MECNEVCNYFNQIDQFYGHTARLWIYCKVSQFLIKKRVTVSGQSQERLNNVVKAIF